MLHARGLERGERVFDVLRVLVLEVVVADRDDHVRGRASIPATSRGRRRSEDARRRRASLALDPTARRYLEVEIDALLDDPDRTVRVPDRVRDRIADQGHVLHVARSGVRRRCAERKCDHEERDHPPHRADGTEAGEMTPVRPSRTCRVRRVAPDSTMVDATRAWVRGRIQTHPRSEQDGPNRPQDRRDACSRKGEKRGRPAPRGPEEPFQGGPPKRSINHLGDAQTGEKEAFPLFLTRYGAARHAAQCQYQAGGLRGARAGREPVWCWKS